MKNHFRSLFTLLLLFTAFSCGKEQFGGATQSESSSASAVSGYQQLSCSSYTLIKPKVDILYVVDNSTSNGYISSDIRAAIQQTVDSISSEFDYRVVGTGLLPIDSTPNDDFQFMTNSSDSFNPTLSGKRILYPSEFNFFTSTVPGGKSEAGARRVVEFMNANTGGIFRSGAYHLVVLVSNGRDREIETVLPGGNGQTETNAKVYSARMTSLNAIKTTLNSQQFRFMAVTAQSSCQTGWLSSANSYVKIARDIYAASGAGDSPSSRDAYDLCGGGISAIFSAVNNSIKQVVVPHTYQYWPITFTDGPNIDIDKIRVYVSSPNSAPALVDDSKWDYYPNPSRAAVNTRILPTPGEPSNAPHLIKFTTGNEVTYPNCISVTSSTKTEYFGYIVLPREPKVDTVVIRINGVDIPPSSTNGWSYVGNVTRNIKVAYPNAGDDQPAITKSGFMIQLNGSGNYYKSGDSVEAYYTGNGI